ncbi:MAG: type III secretion system effector protein [Gammaproteobacteria bacterium]|nr:type III secretion system effector protein [Gammaproteobacteria bacterium]
MAQVPYDQQRLPGIFIEQDNEGFEGHARRALQSLELLSVGSDLLKIISKRAQGVGISGATLAPDRLRCVIRRGPGSIASERAGNTFAFRAVNHNNVAGGIDTLEGYGPFKTKRRMVTGVGGHQFSVARVGTSAVAAFEPRANYTDILGGLRTPVYVALGHELIHCMHFMSGDTNRYKLKNGFDSAGDTYEKHEEARTVGLGIYRNTRISENAIRREAGIPERLYYDVPGDCEGLTSVSA